MNKRIYKKKCKDLFKKATELGVELIFEPNYFNYRRLNCLWYDGNVAEIRVSDSFEITLDICGEIRAYLSDKNDEELAFVNGGGFANRVFPYIKTDKQLYRAIRKGRLMLDNNNWIEYDGIVKNRMAEKSENEENETLIDLGIICDNVLNDDILKAINDALDSLESIKEEICSVAKNCYNLEVSDL